MAEKQIPEPVYDLVIVGGGPAGFTAGLYGARAGLKTLLMEGASTVSQITVTDLIENYPGIPEGINGFDLIERFKKQALQFGAEMVSGDAGTIVRTRWGGMEGWEVRAGGKSYGALAVIVATGAHWRRLGVSGEAAFIGKGVSFCATCDGPFYRDREVAVVGGGNTAVQEALFLTHFARKVTIIHRRDRLRATGILAQRAFDNPKIDFAWNSVVDEITGAEGVQAVRVRDVKTSQTRMVPADGIFIFVGLIPNTDFVRGLVELDAGGHIVVDANMRTSAKGIFGCGDCTGKLLRQVITACGDGATAAYAAQIYVEDLKGESY
ncbi:MAG: Thioredoxin reductase [Syntrophaceae bacterium PtaB.Bin095]|jgi:thioredoxin reductase (NADPH)|nr:MAG: Thioredoxin reductase [Syntrophaceae bacterium PtaB.Bin095]